MSETQKTPTQVKKELKARMKELKPMLPRGTAQEVADKCNVAASYVYEMMAGRRWDLDVIEAIIEIGETNLKRALNATKRVDKILSESGKATQG